LAGYRAQVITQLMSVPLSAARDAAGLMLLPARVEAILDRTEAALSRIERVVADAERVTESADAIATRSESVAKHADEASAKVDAMVGRVERLLNAYGDSLNDLAPLAREAAEALTPDHVRSLVGALDQLPEVIDLIAPAMRGLAALAPDIDELVDRLNAVGDIVEGLPGAGLFRRRGQSTEDDDAVTA
jgi:ABC-type transporter Mla subunit MlaD